MNKKLRLLVTAKCHNKCPMCCNNQFDIEKIPVVDRFDYDEISITGGEPLLAECVCKLDIEKNGRFEDITQKVLTGISAVVTSKPQPAKAAIYNMNGLRVDGSYHGLVISNGRKYISK